MQENNAKDVDVVTTPEATNPAIILERPDIRTSPEVDKIFAALVAAQAEMTDPPKNKTANVPMKNGNAYSYSYADLADLLKVIRPVFGKHGLGMIQVPVNTQRDAVKIVTRVIHTSGQYFESDLNMLVADDKPQTLGSAITYGRRYSAAGVAAIAPDEDEDGAQAQRAAGERQPAGGRRRDAPAPQSAAAKANDKMRSPSGKVLSFTQDGLVTMLHEAQASAPDGIYDHVKPGHKKLLAALCQLQDVTDQREMGEVSAFAVLGEAQLDTLDTFVAKSIAAGKHKVP